MRGNIKIVIKKRKYVIDLLKKCGKIKISIFIAEIKLGRKFMKKIIALLLCLAMCIPVFVGCKGDDPADTTAAANEATTEATGSVTTAPNTDDTDPSNTTEPVETTKGYGYADIVKQNWDGYTFKIWYPTLDNMQTDFICENPNGNVLNDQVYQRNTMVETDLGIDIVTETTGSFATLTQSQFAAGWTEGDFNMFGGQGRSSLASTKNGYFADLGSYDEINPHRDYWDQDFVDNVMMKDSIYALSGEICAYTQTAVQVICFNKDLFSENGLDMPYNAVKNYEWTVDLMLDYMSGFAIDYDNDGYDWDKDRFALSGWGSEGIFYGSGFRFCKNDGETITLDYDRDYLDDVVDVMLEIWCANGSYINMSSATAQHHMPHEIFSSGRGLFCDISCVKIGVFFTEMENDYGILPEPMFNEEQGKYYSFVGSNAAIVLVPATDPNAERTGNIIESLCAASSDVVIPKMFEIVTKIQHARDEESAEMLDIALKSKLFDTCHWLVLSGIYMLPRSLINEKQNLTASYLKMFEKKAAGELEDYVEVIEKLKK